VPSLPPHQVAGGHQEVDVDHITHRVVVGLARAREEDYIAFHGHSGHLEGQQAVHAVLAQVPDSGTLLGEAGNHHSSQGEARVHVADGQQRGERVPVGRTSHKRLCVGMIESCRCLWWRVR